MGNFIVHVEAVGNHGCQRDKEAEGPIEGCGQPDCTDCVSRDFVTKLKATGASVSKATIQHWPTSDPIGPVDDLLTKRRDKKF